MTVKKIEGSVGRKRVSDSKKRPKLAEAADGIGAFELDLESKQWAFSPQLPALFGLDPHSAPANFEEWLRVVFVDDATKIRAAMEAAAQSGNFYVEFRVKRADGKLRWLAGKGQVVANDKYGVRCLRGTYYEIDERKQLEAKLLALNETLEARVAELREEARTLEVLNRTGITIGAELDLERLVQIVTDAGVELSGAQFGAFFHNVVRAEGEAYTLYTLSGAPREAFARFPMPRNTEVFGRTFRGEGPVRSPDILADPRYGKSEPYKGMPPGHLLVRSYLAVPVRARSGEVLGGLFFGHPQPAIFNERAERILLGLAAQAAVAIDNSRLYQNSLNEQLTGGVAHDFNNLLTVIIGNLEALQRHLRDDTLDPGRLQRSADNAMRGARRAESLTQRLLAFSRQQPLAPESVDGGRLVSGMSDLLRRTLGEAIAVETVLAGGLWRAHADPNQLEVALLNLAVNARDAMPDGGKLTIETANVHLDERYAAAQAEVLPGQYVLVAVTDNGCGMTPEVRTKAFDPFYTTKDVGQGTGLGLSQVYGFVKQSRGHVKIYSEVGEGTTVKIYLPRFHTETDDRDEEPVRAAARGSERETILVV